MALYFGINKIAQYDIQEIHAYTAQVISDKGDDQVSRPFFIDLRSDGFFAESSCTEDYNLRALENDNTATYYVFYNANRNIVYKFNNGDYIYCFATHYKGYYLYEVIFHPHEADEVQHYSLNIKEKKIDDETPTDFLLYSSIRNIQGYVGSEPYFLISDVIMNEAKRLNKPILFFYNISYGWYQYRPDYGTDTYTYLLSRGTSFVNLSFSEERYVPTYDYLGDRIPYTYDGSWGIDSENRITIPKDELPYGTLIHNIDDGASNASYNRYFLVAHHIFRPNIFIRRHFNTTGDDGRYVKEFYKYQPAPNPESPLKNAERNDDENIDKGGDGTFDYTSDVIQYDRDPSFNIADTGFVSIFKPSIDDLKNICGYLWSQDIVKTAIKSMFGSPMDCILSLMYLPVNVPSSANKAIEFGAINTNIIVPVCTTQYASFSCGSIKLDRFTGTSLDYAPFTKVQIYLPYIGYRELDVDEIMGKTIKINYRIEILTGSCLASILVNDNVIYQFSGVCGQQIPVTQINMASAYQSAINVATMAIASTKGTVSNSGIVANASAHAGADLSGGVGALQSASSVFGSKNTVSHSGALAGASGILANQKPYLLIQAPRQSLPKKYEQVSGFPCNIYKKLGDLSGFTVINDVHLKYMSCTNKEKEELMIILKGGVEL